MEKSVVGLGLQGRVWPQCRSDQKWKARTCQWVKCYRNKMGKCGIGPFQLAAATYLFSQKRLFCCFSFSICPWGCSHHTCLQLNEIVHFFFNSLINKPAWFPLTSELQLEPTFTLTIPGPLLLPCDRYKKKEMENISLCCHTKEYLSIIALSMKHWSSLNIMMTSISWYLSVLFLVTSLPALFRFRPGVKQDALFYSNRPYFS